MGTKVLREGGEYVRRKRQGEEKQTFSASHGKDSVFQGRANKDCWPSSNYTVCDTSHEHTTRLLLVVSGCVAQHAV
jgi:hypothetical protein